MLTVLIVATQEAAEPVMDALNDNVHFPLLSPTLRDAETTVRSGAYPIDTVLIFEEFETGKTDPKPLTDLVSAVHGLSADVRVGIASSGWPKGETGAKNLLLDFYCPRADTKFMMTQVNEGRVPPERQRYRGTKLDMPEPGPDKETRHHFWELRKRTNRER